MRQSRCSRTSRCEQEHLITLQQQQLLEAELSAKSKDLASMALGVFAKNEVLRNFVLSYKSPW